jgi:hypothetical protein
VFNKIVKKFSLLKSLDEVILPFVLLFWARYLGIFLAGLTNPIEFLIRFKIDYLSLPFIQFPQTSDYIIANSISWVLTSGVLAITFGFIAFRNLHLHEDWLHPKEARSLHSKKIEHFLTNAYEALHQNISWLVATLVAFSLAVADFWFGLLSSLAFGIIIAVTASLIILFALSLEQDSKLESKKV